MNKKGEDVDACLQVLPRYFLQEDKDLQPGYINHHMGRLAWTTVWRSVWSNLFCELTNEKGQFKDFISNTHMHYNHSHEQDSMEMSFVNLWCASPRFLTGVVWLLNTGNY